MIHDTVSYEYYGTRVPGMISHTVALLHYWEKEKKENTPRRMTVRHTSYFELVEKAGRGIMLWRRRRCFFLGLTESAVLFFLRRLDVVLEVAEVLSRVLPAALVRTGFNLLDGICVPNARFVPLILRRFLTLFFFPLPDPPPLDPPAPSVAVAVEPHGPPSGSTSTTGEQRTRISHLSAAEWSGHPLVCSSVDDM